ncbi:MAG: SDR family oxidoreductase [Bryobacteraceae bacterium]|jgi:short-subunit dehydrogenase
METTQRTALVTGASAGIGATFARRLARDGYRLILVARRRERLEELARELGGADVLAADLTRDDELKLVEERILAEPNLELVVNNAGFGVAGRFYRLPVEANARMHQLHVIAAMRLAHAALRAMTARDKGALINVSSVAGFGQTPGSVSYCATKAWMNSFTEGLYLELKSAGSAVKVQALCPGFTYSEFHDVMGMDRGRVPAFLWLRAEDVVEMSLAGLARGKLFVVTGGVYKAIVVLERLIPRFLWTGISLQYARILKRGEPAR